MKKGEFVYSRKVVNGDFYLCPVCGAEIFIENDIENGPFIVYCSTCGAEFDVEFEEENNE